MSGDYKYEISLIADEIAEREYNSEFHDLDQPTQFKVWREAEIEWSVRMVARYED